MPGAFRVARLHDRFDEAFRRISEADHDDFPRFDARSNTYFYRRLDPGQNVTDLIGRFRHIMRSIVDDRTCAAIPDRLREVRVFAEAP